MFIKIDLKEDRRTVAGILAVNGYKVSPSQQKMTEIKKPAKKGDKPREVSKNCYGLEIEKLNGDYEEPEDDDE